MAVILRNRTISELSKSRVQYHARPSSREVWLFWSLWLCCVDERKSFVMSYWPRLLRGSVWPQSSYGLKQKQRRNREKQRRQKVYLAQPLYNDSWNIDEKWREIIVCVTVSISEEMVTEKYLWQSVSTGSVSEMKQSEKLNASLWKTAISEATVAGWLWRESISVTSSIQFMTGCVAWSCNLGYLTAKSVKLRESSLTSTNLPSGWNSIRSDEAKFLSRYIKCIHSLKLITMKKYKALWRMAALTSKLIMASACRRWQGVVAA
jgi:hypothetical protein